MARPRSEKVDLLKQKLVARLSHGLFRSGDRFFSIRGIAKQFSVSYQTADRLLRELAAEGHLDRRHGSGSYVAGEVTCLSRVKLVFDRRARRAGSFGARLISEIGLRLRSDGISFARAFVDPGRAARVATDEYAVVWESPATVDALMHARRTGLLLNDRPTPGLAALRMDSITVDDALGGACAAELIAKRVGAHARVGVLAGPPTDTRSCLRISGFVQRYPLAIVMHTPTWFREDALAPAHALLVRRPEAVFACNDRLAQAVLETAESSTQSVPILFGFDDAPVAELLHLSTIAIPWTRLATAVSSAVTKRLLGETDGAFHLVLAPSPIVRLT